MTPVMTTPVFSRHQWQWLRPCSACRGAGGFLGLGFVHCDWCGGDAWLPASWAAVRRTRRARRRELARLTRKAMR